MSNNDSGLLGSQGTSEPLPPNGTAPRHTDAALVVMVTGMRQAMTLREYRRGLAMFAEAEGISHMAAERMAWGLATGYRQPPTGIKPRGLEPLTWGEGYILDTFAASKVGAKPGAVANVAGVLGLQVAQVEAMLANRAAAGRKGLLG